MSDYSWHVAAPRLIKAKVHLRPGPSFDTLRVFYQIDGGFPCNAVQYESAIYVIISSCARDRTFSIPMDQVALVEWFEEEQK